MNFSFSKISLQTRLLLTTAFALLAVVIAVLSAYRTAQTSAFYAERQAQTSVGAVLRELENGTQISEIGGRNRRIPPHVREALEKYTNEKTRAVAVAVGAEREVSAGFCAANGDASGAIFNQNFTADETPYLKNACRNLDENKSRRYEFKDSTLFLETANFIEPDGEFIGAFAARSVGKSGIFADRFNFATQAFLLASAVGLLIFSFFTLREWRGGMRKIESGLRRIPVDLSERIEAPPIAELAFLSGAINRLAENLQNNLEKQTALDRDLAANEKLAALGRVASGAAHEIRNPLAAMKLKIQLAARSGYDREKLEKTFAVLDEEIARLDNIIGKMLDTGKARAANFAMLAPDQILRARLEMLAEKAAAQNVRIDVDLAENSIKIRADREKLTQVFDNLLLNALEAMPDGGVLHVKSFAENNKIIYEFQDSGAGVSIEEKDKIFEPFYTTKDTGTGLGLAISREIVEAHYGRLSLAESEKGACFRLELPRN